MIFKISSEKIEEFIEKQHSIDGMVSTHDFELWLEEQPTVGEWIPCSERLPEESGKYLGQLDWGNITDIYFSKKWQKWNAHDSQEPKHAIEVVAWMPLPEPYKEGDIDG